MSQNTGKRQDKNPKWQVGVIRRTDSRVYRQIKDKDTGTLQFDWFINNDKTTLGG
jgi:hypothetical protein